MRLLFFFTGMMMFSASITKSGNGLEYQLGKSVRENNFFTVRKLLEKAEGKIPSEKYLYYCALSENKFNECESSNRHIATLLKQYKNKLTDSLIVELLGAKVSNHIRLYQYKSAASTCSEILSKYPSQLDSAAITSYRNVLNLFGALAAVPPQQVSITQDETIAAYRNKFNHLMVPVRSGNDTAEFIFDSGAGLSTLSESYAKKMKFTIIENTVNVGSATTINVQSKMAVADSLFVGSILFRNVVFLVLPDEKLSFPQVHLVINGIIGFPVLYQMKEIRMHKEGKITVPLTPEKKDLHNLFLDNLVPVVAAYSKNDTLLFNLDTGAKTTELSKKYYTSHKEFVDRVGKKTQKHFGGAGGITAIDIYELPGFDLTIGSSNASLTNLPVILTERSFTKNRDGNLGQDVLTKFNELVINFKYMYVDFSTGK